MKLEWKKVRRKGVVAIGEGNLNGRPVIWNVTKSPGGMSYQLHLCEVKPTPLYSGASVGDCKRYAERYL